MPQRTSPRTWPSWLRISVRSLMILILLLGCVLGWVVHRAQVQRDAVAAIHADGGFVFYDWRWKDGSPAPVGNRPWYLTWLEDHVGIDYFSGVSSVLLEGDPSDPKLALVASLYQIEELAFTLPNWSGTQRRSSILTDAGLVYLEGHTRLKGLDLSHAWVTDRGLARLSSLVGLRRLSLRNTLVSDAGLAYLRGLCGLQELDLSETNVSDAGLFHLRGLTGLNQLGLSGTRVSDVGLVHLRGLTGLKQLDLQDTAVSDAGIVNLKSLTSLQSLEVYGTQVDDFGAQELRHALPKVSVDYRPIIAR
jgi:hypothetical protein